MFTFLPRNNFVKKNVLFLGILFIFGLCFVAVIDLGLFPTIANARLNGSDYANDTLVSMQSMSEGWRLLYEDTFLNPDNNSLWFMIRQFTNLVLLVTTGILIYQWGSKIFKGTDPREFIAPILILLFVLYLIGGSASPGVSLAYNTLRIKDYFRDGLMEQSIAGIKLNEVVKDSMLGDHAKSLIAREQEKCQAIVAPPVLLPSKERPTDPNIRITKEQDALYTKTECYNSLMVYAQELKKEAEKFCSGPCASTIRFLNDYTEAFKVGVENELEKLTTKDGGFFNPLGPFLSVDDMVIGGMFFNIFKTLLHMLQHLYVNSINAIYFLSIITFPIACAWTIIPFSSSTALGTWAGVFFGAMLAEFFYIILISLSALIISRLEITRFSDILTALIFGLGAPAASYKMAKFSASGAIASMSSQFSQGAMAIPILGGILAGMTRFRSR